ncbi:MAG: ribbon-helix-helix protein, CopG family [Planctomycetaceae bacterium]|nr:ribbon-helix-helix protein, CopG family [Planctomycetaceae bacterium]
MTDTKTQSRKKRSTSKDDTKKVVSLSVYQTLLKSIDKYAAEENVSRSVAIEHAIIKMFAEPASSPLTLDELPNDFMQDNNENLYASPQLGQSIFY